MDTLPGLEGPDQHKVYIATDMHDIKVGTSVAPETRRGGELKVVMLCIFPGDEVAERRLHRRWARYRLGDTEWFHPCAAIISEILAWIRPGDMKALAALQALVGNHYRAMRDAATDQQEAS